MNLYSSNQVMQSNAVGDTADHSRAEAYAAHSEQQKNKKEPGRIQRTWKRFRPSFGLNSVSEYYATLRLVGYTFEALYSDVGRYLERRYKIVKNLGKDVIDKQYSKLYSSEEMLENDIDGVSDEILTGIRKDLGEARIKGITNKIEATTFLTLTFANAIRDRKKLIADFSEVVGEELGIPKDKIGIRELRRSRNPIFDTLLDRFIWQLSTRSASDLAFLIGLKWGIVAKAVSITLERSAFLDKDATAPDRLRTIISDVQGNNLNDKVKDAVVAKLVDAYQQVKRDHQLPLHSREQVDRLTPVFEHVADLIIDKKINLARLIHIMGGMDMIDPDDAEKSLQNINKYMERLAVVDAGEQVAEQAIQERKSMLRQTIERGAVPLLQRAHEQPAMVAKGI